jgi:Fur family ferric uptake transcriptional regulator
MIQKLELAGTQKRFDGITDNHYHVRCQECGRVDDVPGEPILSIVESLGARTDYKILSHRIELVGLCPRCTRRKGERAGKLADKASRHAAGSGTRGDRFQG